MTYEKPQTLKNNHQQLKKKEKQFTTEYTLSHFFYKKCYRAIFLYLREM